MPPLHFILEHQIVAILRGMPPKDIEAIAAALYAGGIRILEVTLNSADALDAIAALQTAMGDHLLIGAGTVLTAAEGRDALAAGARFLISPNLDKEVMTVAKDAGALSIPGAYTPTEIVTAYRWGADIIKVFPAPGADYIKNVLAPLSPIRLMPTGGIDAGNIRTFKAAGAVAFGVGSALVSSKDARQPNYLEGLTLKARRLTDALNQPF